MSPARLHCKRAGSGIVELISSLLAIQNNRLPPILNYETPDPECRITPADAAHADPGRSFIKRQHFGRRSECSDGNAQPAGSEFLCPQELGRKR